VEESDRASLGEVIAH